MSRAKRRRTGARRRPSRRTRKSLALVFAVLFAVTAPRARAACVEFASKSTITVLADAVYSVWAADVDGDGDIDALSSSSNDDTVAWYENAGNGSGWTLHDISTTTLKPRAARTADLDGDGDLDVAVVSMLGDKVFWFENLPPGNATSWTSHLVSTTGDVDAPYALSAGDIDGDGAVDLYEGAIVGGTGVGWYENVAGDGSNWTLHAIASAGNFARSVLGVDLDRDGDDDLVTTGTPAMAWYENAGGDGSAWSPHVLSTIASFGYAAAAADVDGDGDPDVVAAASIPGYISLTWLENPDASVEGWEHHVISPLDENNIAVATADFDGDGDVDVLAGTGTSRVTWHENLAGDGSTWTPHTLATVGNAPWAVVTADFDGDSDSDVLAAVDSLDTVLWLRNDRLHDQALFAGAATVAPTANQAYTVVTADIDGDGDLDALANSKADDKVAWYENLDPGSGAAWTTHDIASDMTSAFSVAAADVDGDGDLDALAGSKFVYDVAWYENVAGDGSTWNRTTIAAGLSARDISTADVDGDGHLDALTADFYGNRILWHENLDAEGDGSSWSSHLVGTVTYAYSVRAADVDGDGDVDALATGYYDVTLWYENLSGDGTTWEEHTISLLADGPHSIVAADVDADGDLDALLASRQDRVISWHENLSPGDGSSWTPHVMGTTPSSAFDIVAGDLDGDGDIDAATAAFHAQWFENLSPGDGSSWTMHTLSASTNDFAYGVAVGDVDGDGDLDALTALADGNRVDWYRNLGTGVFDDGFDSDAATTACWSTSTPPVP